MKKIILGLLVSLLFIGTVRAQDVAIEMEGLYWLTNLSSMVRAEKDGRGTDIDFKADLSLKDKNLAFGRFTFFINSRNRIRLTYTPLGYETDTTLSKTIELGGRTDVINTRVVGDIKAQYLRLGWAYQFLNLQGGLIKFGTLVELKGLWGDVTLAAPNRLIPFKETDSFYAALPTFGLALDVNPLSFLNVFAEVSGLPAGQYGYMVEAEAGVKFIPMKNISLIGGVRFADIEARDNPSFAKLRLTGPFVGLSLRF